MLIKIIENFLVKDDYKNLYSLKLKNTNESEISIYSNKIKEDNIIVSECIPEKFLKRLIER